MRTSQEGSDQITSENIQCVSKKNTPIPDIFSRNSRKHRWIFIMFGTRVTEKVAISICYSFPPHLTSASALPEKMQ